MTVSRWCVEFSPRYAFVTPRPLPDGRVGIHYVEVQGWRGTRAICGALCGVGVVEVKDLDLVDCPQCLCSSLLPTP